MGVEPEAQESAATHAERDSPAGCSTDSFEQDMGEEDDQPGLMANLTAPLTASQWCALTESCSQPWIVQKGGRTFEADELILPAQHLQGLINTAWVNTDIINAAFRDLNSAQSVVLALPTYWAEKLLNAPFDDIAGWRATTESIAEALPALLDQPHSHDACKYLAIPIHRPGHWVLAVLDVQKKQFWHLDSYQRGASENEARKELNTLQAFFNHHAGQARVPWQKHMLLPTTCSQQYALTDQRPLEEREPGGDCGVFVIANAFALAEDHLQAVRQADMRTIRARIALRLIAHRELNS